MRASPSDGRRKCAPVRQMADENARQSVRWPTVPTVRSTKYFFLDLFIFSHSENLLTTILRVFIVENLKTAGEKSNQYGDKCSGRRKCAPARPMADDSDRTVDQNCFFDFFISTHSDNLVTTILRGSGVENRETTDRKSNPTGEMRFGREIMHASPSDGRRFRPFECGNSTNDRPFFKSERSLSFSPPREPCPPVNGRWCTTDPTIATLPIPLYDPSQDQPIKERHKS
ncbi:unnamed protein product [Microthlaspi erraticum]|uniref:Uncharacterized protein n=1 Tax=Microthlaspi erraticum TaxID=1685480 RepID=A0A6D2HSC1_9BRAS|nr:unnamed protein product [Microthlaspi erraticum]CAA7014033.1 unnamed protein product [Microthlaspi erraticum]CAA7014039.1 unnamed protein product [Microthlaspi erraticum]CAA7015415.1 unnamed protein product [Microthlaspi erraticum]CAA7015421.1 unnamed protein product [Microthlaspi erraticum]